MEKDPGLESLIYKKSKVSWSIQNFVLKDTGFIEKLYTYSILSLLLAFFAYSYLTSISITVDADGEIKFLNPEIPITVEAPFKVKEILVKNNQTVEEGQALLKSDHYLDEADAEFLHHLLTTITETIQKESKDSCDEACTGAVETEVHSPRYNQIYNYLTTDLSSVMQRLRSQTDVYLSAVSAKRQFPNTLRSLEQELLKVNNTMVEIQRRNAIQLLRLEYSELVSKHGSLENSILERKLELANKMEAQRISLADSVRSVEDALKNYNNAQIMKSRHRGIIVYSELRGEGQTFAPGQKPFIILPKKNKLVCVLSVTDIGKIGIGKVVKYDVASLPASEYGVFSGRVIEMPLKVAEDKLAAGNFVVISDFIQNDKKQEYVDLLKQGMKVRSKIIIKHENLLMYLVKTALQLKDDALGAL